MLPILFGVAVVTSGLAAATYKYLSRSAVAKPGPPPTSLGRFAVWGRANAGKTTFITRLRGLPISDSEKKIATTTRTIYRDIPLVVIEGRSFQIEEIVDMPGDKYRRDDWIKLVGTHEHIFYLFNIAEKDNREYMAEVRTDLLVTAEALKKLPNFEKHLNIIASHVDESEFQETDPAEINNVVQADDGFRRLYESMDEVAGNVYTVNLIDEVNFKELLKSIVSDSHA